MKKPILLAIVAYQRYISPYKGFHCAFHAHTGRQTCSGYGYRVFERYGTVNGARLLRRRLAACGAAARVRHGARTSSGLGNRQAGFIDCDCIPGDLLDKKLLECGCDACDLFSEGKRKRLADWSCTDWLILLFVLAITAVIIYLILQ